jgi:DNA-directed RNA polymerase specialized sigma24 family protein
MKPIIKTDSSQQLHDNAYYVDGIKNNDSRVLRTIYSEYSSKITQLVISNHGSFENAKDVFQDVLLSLHTQIQKGLVIQCSFSYFFTLACKRRWLNILKSKYHSQTHSLSDLEQNVTYINEEVSDFLHESEKTAFVRNKLNQMDDLCKELIYMSWEQDAQGKYRGWESIAIDLELSYGYVRKKAGQCKQRLMEMIIHDSTHRQFF